MPSKAKKNKTHKAAAANPGRQKNEEDAAESTYFKEVIIKILNLCL